jgi:phospholipid N-methyltransferase
MFTFLRQGFNNIHQTGSLMASSVYLSRRMTGPINFDKDLQIVELGAGTGNVTRSILSSMNDQSDLAAFEINPVLFDKLDRLNDQRLNKINADVNALSHYFCDQSVDYIISGLPLANMKIRQKVGILNACNRILRPGGYFIQFQYSLNDLGLLKKKFGTVNYGFTLFNIPPAFVYYAQK